MKAFLTILVLAAVSVGVFTLGSLRRGRDGKPLLHVADEVALTVQVATPERTRIIRLVQAPGDVEAVLEVDISAEIVSKIVDMPVEEGDTVQAGDLLCRLDDKNLLADVESAEARIAQLEAAVVQADADREKAERDFDRQVRLSETRATSAIELQDYMTARKKARAVVNMRRHELTQAQAVLKRIREDLNKTVLTSPIDGVVSRLNAKKGEVVVTGTMNNPGTVIMSISDLSKMQVRARVDEVDVPLVTAGQKGRIYLQSDPDTPVPARVLRVAARGVKPPGRDVVTFEALLEVLSTDPRIKPGMTTNVEIEVADRSDAVTIPVEAVVHRMRKDLPDKIVAAFDKRQAGLDRSERARRGQYIKVLYVLDEDVARVRLIDTGIADATQVEVVDGVAPEDLVIVGPYRSLDQLKDGRSVALADDDKNKFQPARDTDPPPDDAVADSTASTTHDDNPAVTDTNATGAPDNDHTVTGHDADGTDDAETDDAATDDADALAASASP
ncbi:MAG: efflux RND transporter periplasmic adaptor subunit [Phycisphaerae bacterium]